VAAAGRLPGRALAGRHPLPWALPVPLRVHGHYSRAEIEAAFGVLTDHAPWIHREGVLWHEPSQGDLLFVTLRKSEALVSPTTRYRDLALGPSLFHWENQSTTTAATSAAVRALYEPRGRTDLVCPRVAIRWLPAVDVCSEPAKGVDAEHETLISRLRQHAPVWRVTISACRACEYSAPGP